MKKSRWILILTAVVSSIVGGVVLYLLLSVPNDLRADALLKQARQEIADGKQQEARTSLSRIVQQYPRTDAAAAATVALVTLGDSERLRMQKSIETLAAANRQHAQKIDALEQSLTAVKNAPPKIVTVQAPAPKPPPKKVTPTKKPTPKKKPARRRR